ncbi:MAG: ABC transporter ATP-binding protein/permease [Lachnospiraceae bacterium]|nr:ABC transporter ATP-binding protein/permease [Lachnospiraceae bacterium]
MSEPKNEKNAYRDFPGDHPPVRPGGRPPRPGSTEIQYPENAGTVIRRMARYFLNEKLLIVCLFAVVIFGTVCGICAPSLQSNAIDIIAGSRSGNLLRAVIFMLVVYLCYSISQFFRSYFSARLSQRIVKRLREELFDKIVNLPIRYMDTHSHGDVMSRMTNDIENISSTVSQSLPSLFSGVLTIIGTVSIMLWYCWQLALLSFTTVILTLIVTRFFSERMRRYSRDRQRLLGQLNGTVEEMVSGYRTVVAYNHQDIAEENFCETSDALTKAGIRAESFGGVMGPVMNCIGNIGFVIIAAFGGYFSIQGLISIGVISAFIVYAKQVSRPINEIAQIYGQLQTAAASAERVFTMLDEENEDKSGDLLSSDTDKRKLSFDKGKRKLSPDTREGRLAHSSHAEIRFRHVDFAYESGHPILRDFSLHIPSGKKVALVGATGSGKTTVVNLLMRFYDADNGEICINDQDIRHISRESLRKNTAIVLQDTVLFSDTIRNNLIYGNEHASEEEILDALKISRCEDFIRRLPQECETVLTASGTNLSQGQRQLLAIARAFVADPAILILDEATSNVDTRTEKNIQDAMQLVMKDRTSIVIAHRLSTIRDSDFIAVMDHGQIVESGNHEELLAKHGKYYELYMTQYAGFAI